jgi:hypothetical protein
MLKLIFILLCSYDQLLSRRQVPSGAGVLCAGGVCAGSLNLSPFVGA